jgi:hypothetical protein
MNQGIFSYKNNIMENRATSKSFTDMDPPPSHGEALIEI